MTLHLDMGGELILARAFRRCGRQRRTQEHHGFSRRGDLSRILSSPLAAQNTMSSATYTWRGISPNLLYWKRRQIERDKRANPQGWPVGISLNGGSIDGIERLQTALSATDRLQLTLAQELTRNILRHKNLPQNPRSTPIERRTYTFDLGARGHHLPIRQPVYAARKIPLESASRKQLRFPELHCGCDQN